MLVVTSSISEHGYHAPGMPQAVAVDAAAVRHKVARSLLPPLFLLALLCQLDRSNLAFAALQMDADLGFSRTVHGLGSGLFFIGYLAQIPANIACVSIGPRRWLPIILACWGGVAMCFAAVQGKASFLILRLLLGVAEAGAYPGIMYELSLFYPSRELGAAYTWVATATAVAGLLGAPLAAALLSLDGAGGLRGWQWLFLVEGMPPFILAAVLAWALPASPLSAWFLTAEEGRWLWREVRRGQGGASSADDVELVGIGGADGIAESEGVGAADAALPAAPTGLEPDSNGGGSSDRSGDGGSDESSRSASRSEANEAAQLVGAEAACSTDDGSRGEGGGPPFDPGWEVDGAVAADAEVGAGQAEHGEHGETGEHAALLPSTSTSTQQRWQQEGKAGSASLKQVATGKGPVTSSNAEGSRGLSRAAIRAGLLDRRVWHLAAAMLLVDVCMNFCNFWIPTLVKAILQGKLISDDEGDDDSQAVHGGGTSGNNSSKSLFVQASLLSALPFCGAALCMVANAQHAKRTNERHLHTALPLLVAAMALALLPLASHSPPAALLALTLAASGIWSTHGPFFSWPSAFLDQKAAALGFALVKTGGAVGAFVGPFLVGAMADALDGYGAAMLVLAGVAAAAAALVYVFDDAKAPSRSSIQL